jgi:hypothetical protein
VILSIRIYRSLYTCSLLSHPVNELPGYFPRLHTLPLATSVQYPVDNLLFANIIGATNDLLSGDIH